MEPFFPPLGVFGGRGEPGRAGKPGCGTGRCSVPSQGYGAAQTVIVTSRSHLRDRRGGTPSPPTKDLPVRRERKSKKKTLKKGNIHIFRGVVPPAGAARHRQPPPLAGGVWDLAIWGSGWGDSGVQRHKLSRGDSPLPTKLLPLSALFPRPRRGGFGRFRRFGCVELPSLSFLGFFLGPPLPIYFFFFFSGIQRFGVKPAPGGVRRKGGRGRTAPRICKARGKGFYPPPLEADPPFHPFPWVVTYLLLTLSPALCSPPPPPGPAPAQAFSRSQIPAESSFAYTLKSTLFDSIYRAQTADELGSTPNISYTHPNPPSPDFYLMITPLCPIFPLFETKKSCPSPSLHPPFFFFLSASLLTERTSLFSGGNGNVQTLNLNWAFLYDV